jgi:acyl-CoA thioester hydrolase
MAMAETRSQQLTTKFIVPGEVIDANGHVNNVAYVSWMQDVAIQHARDTGGTAATHAAGCTWVAREHRVEYLAPAFEGDVIQALTWVEEIRRVQSVRRYTFTREGDGRLLARGFTNWVFVDVETGRPKMIPDSVRACFLL